MDIDPRALIDKIDALGYVIEEELATVLYLMMQLEKPILLEGNPGVGKTKIAYILSELLGYDLIRLQCYEGLDVNNAIYEWNYQKQLLAIKIHEASDKTEKEKEQLIFGKEYLLRRPLLEAIDADRPKVLLIDEVDRSDEEFEAFLLEVLSDFQISIPEMGTIEAKHKPIVVLTSNRTRELSDALNQLANQISQHVQKIRNLKLDKAPGIAETIDWARGIAVLNGDDNAFSKSLSCLLKSEDDIQLVKQQIF